VSAERRLGITNSRSIGEISVQNEVARSPLMRKEILMRGVRFQEPKGFEGIDGLVYEGAPDPQPAIGDALVQVRAASFTLTADDVEDQVEFAAPQSARRVHGQVHQAHSGEGRADTLTSPWASTTWSRA
jgi:hypothetical protein